MHDSKVEDVTSPGPFIAVHPQVVGHLLQRTVRAGEAQSEGSSLHGLLPHTHSTMIWGVDPIMSPEGGIVHRSMSVAQLIDFLTSLDICAPLLQGMCLIPSLLPPLPLPDMSIDFTSLEARRVYIMGYLPSFFWPHLMSRILHALSRNHVLQGELPMVPSSPSVVPRRPGNPVVTPTQAKLYMWQKHFLLEDIDGSVLWILVLEGGQLGPESTPFSGRINVLVKASREKEATLLRMVNEEIDKVQYYKAWYCTGHGVLSAFYAHTHAYNYCVFHKISFMYMPNKTIL